MEGRGRYWLSLLLPAGTAVLIYHAGIILSFITMLAAARSSMVQIPVYFLFLLVPLQIVYVRRGADVFMRVAGLAFAMLLVLRVLLATSALRELADAPPAGRLEAVVLAPLPQVVVQLVFVEMITAAALFAGLIWVNVYSPAMVRWRLTHRLLAATGAAGVVGLLASAALAGSADFVAGMTELFKNVMAVFREAADNAGQAFSFGGADPELLMRAFWDYLLGGFIFGYFVNLSGAWYLGGVWGSRSRLAGRPALGGYALPDIMIWPLIGCWAIVLAARFTALGHVRDVALNGGLVFLFLFGLQGLGVLQHLVARSPRLRDSRRYWMVAVLVLLFAPRLATAVLVAVPLLGVSEIWVKYRSRWKGESDEGDS